MYPVMKRILLAIGCVIFLITSFGCLAYADDGHDLWLRYKRVSDKEKLKEYRDAIKGMVMTGGSRTILAATNELVKGLSGLLGRTVPEVNNVRTSGLIIAGSYGSSPLFKQIDLKSDLARAGSEGFIIRNSNIDGKKAIVITANEDVGVLYGVFHFLSLLQTNQDISNLHVVSFPRTGLRMLNHWDNLDGTRVYPGFSIWDWHPLPTYITQRYIDYARANASIGINAAVLNNVNADPRIITHDYLVKVASLADVFRPYGIRVFLSANFDSPVKLGELRSADPNDPQVMEWWKNKVKEIAER